MTHKVAFVSVNKAVMLVASSAGAADFSNDFESFDMTVHISVAVPAPVDRCFTYASPVPVARGTRVLVSFGRRDLVGVSLGVVEKPEVKTGEGTQRQSSNFSSDPAAIEIKSIKKIVDESPIFSADLLQIAQWLHTYYMHPLGEVLKAMIPASIEKKLKQTVKATELGKTELSAVFKKRASLTLTTFKKRLAEFYPEMTLAKAKKLGWAESERETQMLPRIPVSVWVQPTAETLAPEAPHVLTPEQEQAFMALVETLLSPSSPCLLHGITGSGKTELYLRLIDRCWQEFGGNAQALVLVPEISLTPQMTQVFSRRFPGSVAVVHSAMDEKERWQQLDLVRSGQRRILIGPRSAVFSAFLNLKLIVVDEEQDSSYKQMSGLCYHGRDVAVVRGQITGAAVILGSATPSLETFHNAKTHKYKLVRLFERASKGIGLPEVSVAAGKPSFHQGERLGETVESVEVPVSPEIISALKTTVERGEQAMVIVNRRGYAFYLINEQTREPVSCPSCSITLTLHGKRRVLRCHYCDYRVATDMFLKNYPGEKFVAVGYGSEKTELYLEQVLPGVRIARVDSDTTQAKGSLADVLGRFRNLEVDILVGTQMLAKGHDFPNVTLIALLEVDQLLHLPDFRAGERTFQLLVQASGRAGRADKKGTVILQCLRQNNPVIQHAMTHDYLGFAEQELEMRRDCGYPPFSRLIQFEWSAINEETLDRNMRALSSWLQKQPIGPGMKFLGPSSPPIAFLRGRHRRVLLLVGKQVRELHTFAHKIREFASTFQTDMRVDVDPQSFL
jgi:primosomal protein N' (replication factor Y) (superfamily II helicase)